MKGKKHIIISTDAEKVFDNIQHLFIIRKKKQLNELGIEGNYLNIIKSVYEKPRDNVILKGEKLRVFSLRSGRRPG